MHDPGLIALRAELERAGLVVVPHGEHFCVRLPLLASVVVRVNDGVLRAQPQFGPFLRSRALVLGAVGVPAVIAALFAFLGATPLTLAAAALGAGHLAADVYRLILTEGCLTRVQMLFAGVHREAMALPAPIAYAAVLPPPAVVQAPIVPPAAELPPRDPAVRGARVVVTEGDGPRR